MYVIFDSNIWISELGLNSSMGAAVRFFVKNKGATVVLPEVVRLETERNLKAALTKYVGELEKNYRQLLTVFGKLKELVLPDAETIEAKVAAVFGECQLELLEIPLSLESARSSFLKVVDKIPPNKDKDQQFKDGVIWADCVRLLETADVYLVTEDKGFYKGREPKNGLAEALKLEVKNAKHAIYVFDTLSALLQEIRTEVRLDEKTLVSQFWENNRQSIESILERNDFVVVDDPEVTTDLYVTEDPNRLYTEFRIFHRCEDLLSDGRSDAILLLKGDCTYLVDEKLFSTFRNHGEELSYKTKEGEEKSQLIGVLCADDAVVGHRFIEHSIKYKLDD
jgi:PIN domain